TMPITMTAFFIGALSIIGLPPMGGAWSKWFLALGALEAEQRVLVGVLLISSLLNVAYLMPIVARAFFVPPPAATDTSISDGVGNVAAAANESAVIKEAPMFCLLALGTTALGCLLLFFYADELYRLLTPIVMP
ncbi:MAG: monovalent cation/H+ antiporter subunit D family protein, partial [Acidobacteria bacterium]|nr:monovalent cation/H+ antiporter subunit D family protein [Acidobacteriota bacterium]